jgi:uncharacterized protein YtpQ (UPF0354 family)
LYNEQVNNLAIDPLPGSIWRLGHPETYGDDVSVLLLARLWEDVKKHFYIEQLAVSVPATDCLLFCDAEDEYAMDALRETSLQIFGESSRALSKSIFWWNPKEPCWQLEPYHEVPDM